MINEGQEDSIGLLHITSRYPKFNEKKPFCLATELNPQILDWVANGVNEDDCAHAPLVDVHDMECKTFAFYRN